MLNIKNETDFYELKCVAKDRLRPDGISAFFLVSFLYSGIMTGIAAFAIKVNFLELFYPILGDISNIALGILAFQFAVAIFFSSQKISFKFQKLQATMLSIVSIKFSIDSYFVYFIICVSRNQSSFDYLAGTVLLIGGFVLLIFSTVRGFKRVNQGEFRKGGKLLYDFQQSKAYVSLPVIFGATMIGGSFIKALSNMSGITPEIVELYFILFITVVIQYGIAMAWPEFLLVTICKYKFDGFIVERPVFEKNTTLKLETSGKPFKYWISKPFSVIKSRTGWGAEEKAPLWMLLISWVHLFLYVFLAFIIVFIIGLVRGKLLLTDASEFLVPLISPSVWVGLILTVLLLIIFKVVRMIARGI